MIPHLQDRLEAIVADEDSSTALAYELTDELQQEPDGFEAVGAILDLLEKNPSFDFGAPGPLVHFVETYSGKGYESLLIESTRRRPTCHTLWMVNRVLNDVSSSEKALFLEVLDAAISREDLEENVRHEAKEFRALHD